MVDIGIQDSYIQCFSFPCLSANTYRTWMHLSQRLKDKNKVIQQVVFNVIHRIHFSVHHTGKMCQKSLSLFLSLLQRHTQPTFNDESKNPLTAIKLQLSFTAIINSWVLTKEINYSLYCWHRWNCLDLNTRKDLTVIGKRIFIVHRISILLRCYYQ